jgi:hypothetical protein
MGRVGGFGTPLAGYDWRPMDLFTYSSPGVHDYSDGVSGVPTYFSNDGSVLSYDTFNQQDGKNPNKNDTADFTNQDVFGTFELGETNTLSLTDEKILDALGWAPALQQDFWTGTGSGDWTTAANWQYPEGSSGSLPNSLDAFINLSSGGATVSSNVNETVHSIGINRASTLVIGGGSDFVATNGTVLYTNDVGFTLRGGNAGTIDVDVGSQLTIGNTFQNSGAVNIGDMLDANGGNGALSLNGAVTLDGGGSVNVGEESSQFQAFSTGSINGGGLTNVDNTISGGGSILLGSFDNQSGGTVEATQPEGFSLQIGASSFSNEGTMTAQDRATLDLGQDGAYETLANSGTIDLQGEGALAISGNLAVTGGGNIAVNRGDITSDARGADTLTNLSNIEEDLGSGQIGDVGVFNVNDLTFNNSGTVSVIGSGNTLTVNTGGNVIGDGNGTMEAANGANLVIDSNINTGVLFIPGHPESGGTIEAAPGGVVTVAGAVTGQVSNFFSRPGQVLINGGTFDLLAGASDTDPINFSGTGGTLEVNRASTTLGTISGLAVGDSFDARFMPFDPSVSAQVSESADGSAGTLTLSNGAASQTFNFTGNYTFSESSDGNGGTLVQVVNPTTTANTALTATTALIQQSNGDLDYLQFAGTSLVNSDQVSPDTSWTIAAEGDFNGDGQADLVVQDPNSGAIDLLFLQNGALQSSSLLQGNYSKVVGAGDFDGSGRTGIATQDPTTGQIDLLWFTGTQLTGSELLNGSYQPVVGTADFNDDGKTDFVTQSQGGGPLDFLFFNNTDLTASALTPQSFFPVHDANTTGVPGQSALLSQDPNSGQIDYLGFSGTTLTSSNLEATNLAGTTVLPGTQVAAQLFSH